MKTGFSRTPSMARAPLGAARSVKDREWHRLAAACRAPQFVDLTATIEKVPYRQYARAFYT
jgi:hypothetical protein